MRTLREAVLSKGVPAEALEPKAQKEILPDSVFDSLQNVGGGDDTGPGMQIFGMAFGMIPF